MAYGDAAYDGIVGAAGTLTVSFGPGARTRTWTVSQVSVEMSSAPVGATCAVRKGGRLVTLLIAQGDVAGGDPPIVLRGGETMTVEWAGCTAGDVGHVLVVYREDAS